MSGIGLPRVAVGGKVAGGGQLMVMGLSGGERQQKRQIKLGFGMKGPGCWRMKRQVKDG